MSSALQIPRIDDPRFTRSRDVLPGFSLPIREWFSRAV
jgi:hypothetical protein